MPPSSSGTKLNFAHLVSRRAASIPPRADTDKFVSFVRKQREGEEGDSTAEWVEHSQNNNICDVCEQPLNEQPLNEGGTRCACARENFESYDAWFAQLGLDDDS